MTYFLRGGKSCPKVLNETRNCGSGICPNFCNPHANAGKCNVCKECCQSYITQGDYCNQCVDLNCPRYIVN